MFYICDHFCRNGITITLQNRTHFTTQTHHISPNFPTSVVFLMIHDELLVAFGDESFMFLTLVGYWPTMAVTGPPESLLRKVEGAQITNPDTGRQ